MRVNCVNNLQFGRAYSSRCAKVMENLCNEGKQALGLSDDYTMLDFPSFAFYSSAENDTGRGKLNSDEALKMVGFLKTYTGLNALKDYPFGREIKHMEHYYCPYNRSSVTIGEDQINLFKLTTPEYGSLLEYSDLEPLVKSNLLTRKAANKINYENEIGTSANYPIFVPLKKAYENFKKDHNSLDDPLKAEFEAYKKDPVSRDYDRIALYPFISKKEPDFFKGFAKSPAKQKKFEEYKKQYADEIEFFKFRQFIAFKDKLEAKSNFNKMGVEVVNDVAIGFSPEEYWAFPDAFNPNYTAGYGFYLPKYNQIEDETSELHNLLKHKFELNLRTSDSLRIDVGVAYESFRQFKRDKNGDFNYNYELKPYNNDGKVIEFIEKTAKEIKGDDYDLGKLIYEGDGDTQYIMNWEPDKVTQKGLNGRTIMYTSVFQHNKGLGWGSVNFLKNVLGLKDREFMFGTENHDNKPLRMLAEEGTRDSREKVENSIPVLSSELGISENKLKDPKKWIRAKLEELFLVKNRFLYFMDVFGKKEYINDHSVRNVENFRDRLTENYETEFHTGLQNGYGFNYPEIIARTMKATGANKNNKALYKKLKYLGEYLREEGVKTQAAADREVELAGRDRALDELHKIDRKFG